MSCHLNEAHRDSCLLLSTSSLQPLVSHLGRRSQVDDEVQWEADVVIQPVVPGEQHFQLGPTQGTFLFGVLNKISQLSLHLIALQHY